MTVAVIKDNEAVQKEFPRDFKHWKDIETERYVLKTDAKSIEYWNDQGVYQVEREELGENQKQGSFSQGSLVENKYIIPAIDKTQEELDRESENAKNSDASAIKGNNHKSDGEAYLQKKFAELWRYADTPTKEGYVANIREQLWDYLAPLQAGLWDVTQTKLNDLRDKVIAGQVSMPNYLRDFMLELKADVDQYMNDKF